MFTNILRKNWKPIPLAALFALLPPKKVGERGGLRTGRPQGVYQACGATQQECHGEHRQSWGHQRSGVLGTQGPRSASPTYPSTTVSLTHTRTHTHTQSCTLPRLTSHDTNVWLHSHNTIIRPCKTSPQSNTQPHCAQHQVTRVCIHSWRISMHTYSRSLHSNY